MPEQLKSCPVCGGEANIRLRQTRKHLEIKIKCNSCTASIEQCYIRLRDDIDGCKNLTIRRWNRRQGERQDETHANS
jgi:hypothetical protein